MSKRVKGTLVIIGGAERKDEHYTVLSAVADRLKANQHLLIVTAASYEPEGTAEDYTRIFKELGVRQIDAADVRTRGMPSGPSWWRSASRQAPSFLQGAISCGSQARWATV